MKEYWRGNDLLLKYMHNPALLVKINKKYVFAAKDMHYNCALCISLFAFG